jgi:DNA-binding YbaB/EbfC family protein
MMGNIGQLMHLLRNAGQIREGLKDLQERLAAARFVGEAGAGLVRATVDGRGELVDLKIQPASSSAGDLELLEELICAAVREAMARSREAVRAELQALTGGVDLGGMLGMFGGDRA